MLHGGDHQSRRNIHTLLVWFQLGELRRFSEGEISESGRGMALALFTGDDIGVTFLEMRNGCTCGLQLVLHSGLQTISTVSRGEKS